MLPGRAQTDVENRLIVVEKVLFDTDIGSDIDDAVALAWLLANSECELLGITTVSGQPVERARLASMLCRVAGADIPIVPGSARPMEVEARQPLAPQSESLSRWEHRSTFPAEAAIDFMAGVIDRHPGEVTLLSVGPMTNIAALFQRHPETPMRIKRLVVMGGRFGPEQIGQRPAEWNVYCDPHAAEVVLGTATAETLVHGLDVTSRVRMDAAEVRSRFKAPLLEPVLDMAEEWFNRRPLITFHDPLAAVCAFDTSICTYQRGAATVKTGPGPDQGETAWNPSPAGGLEVALDVKPDRFFERYFEVFS